MNWYKIKKEAWNNGIPLMENIRDRDYDPYVAIYGNPGEGDGDGQNKTRFPDSMTGGRPYTKNNKPPKHSELPENHMEWENMPHDLPSSDHEFVDSPDSDMDEKRPKPGREGVNDGTFYDTDSPISTVQKMNDTDKDLDNKPGIHNMPRGLPGQMAGEGAFERAKKTLKRRPVKRR
jgi:hypothetical protein